MNAKKRLIRTAVLCFVGLGIGAGIAYYQITSEPVRIVKTADINTGSSQPMAGVALGGPFSLTDHTGKSVTDKDYDGQYKLIYFGFTYCPAICPTELQKMAKVYGDLSAAEQQNVRQLFITIDPERDTVDVMREYVDLFHPTLTGLSGTVEQIDAVKQSYRVFATKVQNEDMSDYTMDHSSYIYLMSPDNSLLSLYRMADDAEHIANDMRKFLPKP